jgi:hypothetical protein
MTLAAHLIGLFPEPPPFGNRPVDQAWLAELMPEQPRRLKHIAGVVARGRELSAELGADAALAADIEQAALCHDIGYAGALKRTGFHPLDGAVFLAHRGASDTIIHAVLHHSGAREGAKSVPAAAPHYLELPAYAPDFLSDAITWCDTQTSPDGERVTIAERVREVEERYGAGSATGRAMRAMEPEFVEIFQRMRQAMPWTPANRSSEPDLPEFDQFFRQP